MSFNSDSPNIVAIYWSDYSFTVNDAAAGAKPAYQVVSPAQPA